VEPAGLLCTASLYPSELLVWRLFRLGRYDRGLSCARRIAPGCPSPHRFHLHRAWLQGPAGAGRQQQVEFHKNVAMIGGLLFAALA